MGRCTANQTKPFKRSILTLIAVLLSFEILAGQADPPDGRVLRQGGDYESFFRNGMLFLFPSSHFTVREHDVRKGPRGNLFTDSKFGTVMSDTLFQPVPGPYGGTVRHITHDSNGWLFIGTDGGVYRSTDNGAHWDTNLFPTQLFNFIEPVTVLGPNVVVAETDFNNFISWDGGESWRYLFEDAQGFAVDTNGNIYAGSNYSGVKVSKDTAKTWTTFGLDGEKIYKAVICGGGQFVCPSDSGVYFSSDSGMTWLFRNYAGNYIRSLVCDENGNLFGIQGPYIYRSSDFGNSWSQLLLPDNKPGESPYRIYAMEDNHLFVVTYRRILSSSDAGETWNQIIGPYESPLTVGQDVHGNFLAGGFEGIYRRNQMTGEWDELNTGIHAQRIEEIAITSAGSILVLSLGRCFRSTDYGNTWMTVHFDSTIYLQYFGVIRSFSSGSVFMTAHFDGKGGLVRSVDDGVSWEKISGISNQSSINGITEGLPGEIAASTYNGDIYRSIDGGDSWIQVVTSATSSGIRCIASDKEGNYYAAKDSSVLISHNGIDWEEVLLIRDYASWESIVVDKSGDVFLGSSIHGVYHSYDKGETWSLMNEGLYNKYVMSAAADDSGNVFLGTSRGIFQLADSVDRWVWFSTGFPSTFTLSLAVSPQSYLFAGTQSYGMYKSVTPMKRRIPVPEPPPVYNFRLSQNYPNPFNDQTIIQYEVPSSGKVELKIYNVLGQLVTTLVSGNLPAGEHSIEWKPNQLSSGLYFCRLTAQPFSYTYERIIKILYLK
jgi:photosystem II stability/assembly factor-like uncharacterized protein